ncbi:ABC transporter ATP-binding protein [Yoonia sp.]|uniref:ABC transporter ATP-binding protein n=1 Tax=Yoonia sp. TaxID=2212373 RepID=UPI00391CC7A5
MTAAAVSLNALTKRFNAAAPSVNNINLEIAPGTLVTLLGPSGCGKTTTLRMIAGLETPSEGRIMIGDTDVTRMPPERRDVTMVFQSYALFPHMDVYANVAYGLRVARRPVAEVKERVAEALALVGLDGFGDRRVDALSGGQQQRVALARALVMKPKVVLFDEPLSNLDAKLRRRVRGEIRALQQRLGLTAVYVTHDQEEALAISDKVVVMNAGRIEQIGSPHELYHRPASLFVADFVGRANVLQARWDGQAVQLGEMSLPMDSPLPVGPVQLILRPEGVRLARNGEAGLSGRITDLAFVGGATEVSFDTALGQVEAAVLETEAAGLCVGDTHRLAFDRSSTHILPTNAA